MRLLDQILVVIVFKIVLFQTRPRFWMTYICIEPPVIVELVLYFAIFLRYDLVLVTALIPSLETNGGRIKNQATEDAR